MEKEFEKVDAPIIGADGNVFNLIGICSRKLKNNGYSKEAKEMQDRVTQCHSYEEALSIMTEYVNPVSDGYDELDDYDDYESFGI